MVYPVKNLSFSTVGTDLLRKSDDDYSIAIAKRSKMAIS
jgi:hypothetical protein